MQGPASSRDSVFGDGEAPPANALGAWAMSFSSPSMGLHMSFHGGDILPDPPDGLGKLGTPVLVLESALGIEAIPRYSVQLFSSFREKFRGFVV